jgi:hypothetical protein
MVLEGREVRPSKKVRLHPTQSSLTAMKRNPDFVHHRKITTDRDSGKLFARRHGLSRTHDVIVAGTLLVLLVVAIVTRATISDEITDSSLDDRRSYAAYAIDVVATLGLSIGLAVLLLSSRPRADDEGARS